MISYTYYKTAANLYKNALFSVFLTKWKEELFMIDDGLGQFPDQKKRQKDFNCSLGFAMTVIGSKWRAIVLWHILKAESVRYGQLKKSIPNISHKILAQELKKLEGDGLILRKCYEEIPPKVEYRATGRGKSLKGVLSELCRWGKKYMKNEMDG